MRLCRRCLSTAIRTEAGQTFVWTIEGGKLIRRNVPLGRRDEATARVEINSALPVETQVLAARFDNLKDRAVPRILRARRRAGAS